jgi:hypothetical protein
MAYIENKRAIVEVDDQIIFQSDESYDVKEVFCEDIDLDGKKEIVLSLWKHGNFGEAHPFWIKENDNSYKMHLFLYEFKNDKLTPLWHSSNLVKQNLKLIPVKSGFIAIEKIYDNLSFSVSFPIWNGFGFDLQTIDDYQF